MTSRFPGGARRARLLLVAAAVLILGAAAHAVWTRPAPLQSTYASPEAAADAVVAAMRAGDLDRLRAMALTEDEFRRHVWPHLPAARPERNVPFEFVWNMLRQNSEGHLRQTLAQVAHTPLDVRAVRFAGATSSYADVIVHRDSEVVVAGADGSERVMRLFGSLIEQNGRYKVFSYVVDD